MYTINSLDIAQMFVEARWACITHARPGQHPKLEIYVDDITGDLVCDVMVFPKRSALDDFPIRAITIHTFQLPGENDERSS